MIYSTSAFVRISFDILLHFGWFSQLQRPVSVSVSVRKLVGMGRVRVEGLGNTCL